jgi:hypothetical protein
MPDIKHIIYSADDIHRYFSGKMSAAEMHAMEKASLEDTLLAEAMEGYYHLPAVEFSLVQKQLDELKEKISGKTKKYDNTWWEIAAAVLLLISVAFAFYKMSKNDTKQESVVVKQDSIVNNLANKTTIDSAKNPQTTVAMPVTDSSVAIVENNTKQYKAETKQKLKLNTAELATINVYDRKPAKNIALDNITDEVKANGKSVSNFSGKVTDANNDPIPFANIIINNRQQSKTDVNGLFNLSLPDSSIRLDIVAADYYPKTINITANDFTEIVLASQKNILKKGALVTDTNIRSTVQILYKRDVEPREGWEKYRLFLVDQFSNSEYDDGRRVSGETIVQFEINESLMPDNFQFEKSIDEDVDNAIENFIINHSDWKFLPYGGAPGIVRLRIIF